MCLVTWDKGWRQAWKLLSVNFPSCLQNSVRLSVVWYRMWVITGTCTIFFPIVSFFFSSKIKSQTMFSWYRTYLYQEQNKNCQVRYLSYLWKVLLQLLTFTRSWWVLWYIYTEIKNVALYDLTDLLPVRVSVFTLWHFLQLSRPVMLIPSNISCPAPVLWSRPGLY